MTAEGAASPSSSSLGRTRVHSHSHSSYWSLLDRVRVLRGIPFYSEIAQAQNGCKACIFRSCYTSLYSLTMFHLPNYNSPTTSLPPTHIKGLEQTSSHLGGDWRESHACGKLNLAQTRRDRGSDCGRPPGRERDRECEFAHFVLLCKQDERALATCTSIGSALRT